MKTFIIFPNSLFYDITIFEKEKYDNIFIVEEPIFFGHDKKYKNYNINKIKLAYMRASMKYYYDWLKSKIQNINYIEYNDVKNYAFLKKENNNIVFYDPIDYNLEDKLLNNNIKFTKIDTLLFNLPASEIIKYFQDKKNKNSQRIIHGEFYIWMKKKLKVLENISSKDNENRKSLPKNNKLVFDKLIFKEQNYYDDAIKWVNNHTLFKNNIGSTDKLNLYPINEIAAKKQFNFFLKNKVNSFGDYEDAIDVNDPMLYHSLIGAPLNIGILSSKWVLSTIMSTKNIPINSLEGYVRQLTWRCFMFGIYSVFYKEIKIANHFEFTNKLNWDYWYGKKEIGIEILDNEIKKALKFGYSHHIVRLEVFLNIFILTEIKLDDVIKWFSEVIAIDSFDWVMYSNIISMGYYDTRFMNKPYITSSAYLLKMSNYEDGNWSSIWTSLFYNFISKYKNKLIKGSSIYLRNLSYFEKKTQNEKNKIKLLANNFIKKITK